MSIFTRVCIVGALMLMPTGVWATHPLEVEDTGTLGYGNYQFELTGDYLKDNSLKTTKLSSIITAGSGEYTDFSLEAPYLMLNPGPDTGQYEDGKGDVRLKMKHQLFENEVRQSMAYQVYVDIPTGDHLKGLGTNNVLWGVMLIDSQKCHDKFLHLNVGYEITGRDWKKGHYADDYAFRFGLAVEHKVMESLRFMTELAGESRKESSLEVDAYTQEKHKTYSYSRPFTFLAGIIYDLSASWNLDLGVRAGLNKYAEDYTILAGTSWKF